MGTYNQAIASGITKCLHALAIRHQRNKLVTKTDQFCSDQFCTAASWELC